MTILKGGEIMKNLPIIFAVVLVLVAAGAFFGGMKYQQNKAGNGFSRNTGQVQGQFRQRNGAGGMAVNGDVLSIDSNTLTVKLTDGSSKIVTFSDKTTVSQASASATANIKTGERVAIFGVSNSDGSVTAQNIQINPIRNF